MFIDFSDATICHIANSDALTDNSMDILCNALNRIVVHLLSMILKTLSTS